jgi:hypothetical protein
MAGDDERRVRTMAGWIGVEISRSRVRTAGKAGHGLYRVRGSKVIERARVTLGPDMKSRELSEWTGYAYTLTEIESAAQAAIESGTHAGPGLFAPAPYGDRRQALGIPVRWTSAYRGPRDLGAPDREVDPIVPVAVRPEYAAELNALVVLLDAGVVEMVHVEGCGCDVPARFTAACVAATMPDRMRQRADNAAFQAAHLRRRAYGLRQRYAEKSRRNTISGSD